MQHDDHRDQSDILRPYDALAGSHSAGDFAVQIQRIRRPLAWSRIIRAMRPKDTGSLAKSRNAPAPFLSTPTALRSVFGRRRFP